MRVIRFSTLAEAMRLNRAAELMANSNRFLWSVFRPHKSTSIFLTSLMTYGRREPNRQGENNLKKFRLRVPGDCGQRRFSTRPSDDTSATAVPERSRPASGRRSSTALSARFSRSSAAR